MKRSNTGNSDRSHNFNSNARKFFDAKPTNEAEKRSELKATVDKFFGGSDTNKLQGAIPVRPVHTAVGGARSGAANID